MKKTRETKYNMHHPERFKRFCKIDRVLLIDKEEIVKFAWIIVDDYPSRLMHNLGNRYCIIAIKI